VVVEDQKIVK